MDNDADRQSRGFGVQLDTFIKTAAVFLMLYWCFTIVSPFLTLVLWGAIIAVILEPLCNRITPWCRSRHLAATAITLVLLAIFITPMIALVDESLEFAQALQQRVAAGQLSLPPPDDSVRQWPLVGELVGDLWQGAYADMPELLRQHQDKLQEFSRWLLGHAKLAGLTILKVILSIVIAGVFVAMSAASTRFAHDVICRLAGERGEHFAALAGRTVRNVAQGIIGVAILQAALAGMGFYLAGLPAPLLLSLLVLTMSIVQVNPLLLMLPLGIYAFGQIEQPVLAVLFMVWSIAVGLLDNLLKPLIMGKDAGAPMMVVFLGAIGGFISYGFIGLFVGAVVIVLGYSLFIDWLYHEPTR